ncbi:unnamed protein product [Calypogeia fissa]
MGWILEREVNQAVFLELIADQPVQGFTNGDFFGSMRRDIQEAILLRSERKRILKEGPSNTLLGNLFEEEEGEEANIYVVEVTKAEAEVATEEMHAQARLFSAYRLDTPFGWILAG